MKVTLDQERLKEVAHQTERSTAFLTSAANTGIIYEPISPSRLAIVADQNGAVQSGLTKPHGTLRDGLRCSTAKAFLRPALDRPNLHVSLRSTVLKVQRATRATGA